MSGELMPLSGRLPVTYSSCASITTSADLSSGLGLSGAPAIWSRDFGGVDIALTFVTGTGRRDIKACE